jgi:transcriptional regulator with XRE-family HTH domain
MVVSCLVLVGLINSSPDNHSPTSARKTRVLGGTAGASLTLDRGAYASGVSDQDIRDFLASRRAKISPERAGLQLYGSKRRVPGLRREEVALLADISVEYYTRLERGEARGVSNDVLDAVSRALQLDEAEHAHLLDLVRIANLVHPPRRSSGPQQVRPSIRRLVDELATIPAFVFNGRHDVLYANPMAEALFIELLSDPVHPPNSARYLFLDPRAKTFYADWDSVAHDVVAALRSEAGRAPYDRALSDLVGLLSTRSAEFRVLWAGHDVRFHRTGVKGFRHPLVGDMTLAWDALPLPADPGLALATYSAEPGSASEAALGELARWAAKREQLASIETQS